MVYKIERISENDIKTWAWSEGLMYDENNQALEIYLNKSKPGTWKLLTVHI